MTSASELIFKKEAMDRKLIAKMLWWKRRKSLLLWVIERRPSSLLTPLFRILTSTNNDGEDLVYS